MDAVDGASRNTPVTRLFNIGGVSEAIATLLEQMRTGTEGKIRSAFARELKKDPALLEQLVSFVGTLSDGTEEQEESETDDEEDVRQPRAGREAAFEAYTRAVRAQARSDVSKRPIGKLTRNGKSADGFAPNDLAPLEVDVILLTTLRAARGLLADRRISGDLENVRHANLKTIEDLFRTQIVVDEATDFSPLQLACMAALCDPASQSFLACGDFNQRITDWGSRSEADLKWVFPDIDIRSVNISYRHSRQLSEFAKRIALLSSSSEVPEAQLPQHVDNEGVAPVLATGLSERKAIAAWLAERIVEIERFTGGMPSIALLVNDEEDVGPVAAALDAALVDKNIRAVACSRGQTVGQDNDVRVFDVQHIKGLEFEAVFFVGVDELAKRFPALFDKYLYVGATRAAYYLGLTTSEFSLPSKLANRSTRASRARMMSFMGAARLLPYGLGCASRVGS
ncbi:ATP-binding domain-containing protein [Bradyrhizobium sp. 168]|uniref:ATP-binding domain-containing protein n=1 Tax=Bradyrhizobium sp. 168 TaxID=2782639 RepID=UPI001FFA007A|nr:ATP-binding domain-containing protein [Bradyrhizobium sp. 168]MCK1580682.1 ATP-binding domain-containing protein [Bradyrhizobium sp. 168]